MDLIFTLAGWWNDIFGGVLSDVSSLFNYSANDLLSMLFGTVTEESPLIYQTIYNLIKGIMSIFKVGGVALFDISLFSLMFSGGVIAYIVFAIFKYLLDFSD